jgi:hypothetical protein
MPNTHSQLAFDRGPSDMSLSLPTNLARAFLLRMIEKSSSPNTPNPFKWASDPLDFLVAFQWFTSYHISQLEKIKTTFGIFQIGHFWDCERSGAPKDRFRKARDGT